MLTDCYFIESQTNEEFDSTDSEDSEEVVVIRNPKPKLKKKGKKKKTKIGPITMKQHISMNSEENRYLISGTAV